MAKARQSNGNRKRGGSASQWPEWSNEVVGLILICFGVLFFLSVISYTPGDLPVLGMFKGFAPDSAPNVPRVNLIGPVGTLLGVMQLALFGAVGYLIPMALVWFGVVKMVFDGRLWPRTLIGFVILILSGSVALQGIGVWFAGWAKHVNITGPGGLVGLGLGDHVLRPLLGQAGTVLVSGCVYLIGLVLLTGMPPIRFAKEVGAMTSRGMSRLWTWWRERGKAPAPAPKAARKRAGRKKEAAAAGEADEEQQLLPLRETPTPQIIDASQQKNQHPAPGDKPFERPKPEHQGLSTDGFEDYELPGFDLLDEDENDEAGKADEGMLRATQQTIIDTLKSFGIEVAPGNITHGPTITRYEIYPNIGLRVSRISQLEADIARATKAERINILAPIPGKDTVGIEIANSQKISVPLHELLKDPEFRSAKKRIPLVLGKDVYGKTVIGDLAAMPHLLIAGATGSGKSVCVNSIIASILFKFTPDELRFIMVDPKVVEMQMYNKLPHLIVPVVTDPHKVVPALKWVVDEMERRYKIFAKAGVRNFEVFNKRPRPEKEAPAPEPEPEPEADPERIEQIAAELEAAAAAAESAPSKPRPRKFSEEFVRWAEGDDPDPEELDPSLVGLPELAEDEDEMPDNFPYIVVIIDELADLMQTAPADVEMNIARIAQKARAAGIHLIIATQTPRADVVTGIIKANIPCRIAFQVSSQLDSRVILDVKGAEKLVGKGDMLYLPPGSAKHERSQGAFVSDEEVERLVDYCAAQGEPRFEEAIQRSIEKNAGGGEESISDADEETIVRCIEVIRQEQKASTSLLQRRLRLGYTRAARMVDILEQRGLVGPGDGAKAREVFLPPEN